MPPVSQVPKSSREIAYDTLPVYHTILLQVVLQNKQRRPLRKVCKRYTQMTSKLTVLSFYFIPQYFMNLDRSIPNRGALETPTLQSPLTILQPNISTRVQAKQMQQKSRHDQHAQGKLFAVDDPMFVRNLAPSHQSQRRTYFLFSELGNGCVFHRHINHIQHCTCATPPLHIYRQDFLPSPIDNSVSPHC